MPRHISKDPGSHNVVSSRLDVCRQPSRAPTHGLFLPEGGGDTDLQIGAIQHSQFGDGSADGFVKRLPCVGLAHTHEGRSRHVQGVGKGFQDG